MANHVHHVKLHLKARSQDVATRSKQLVVLILKLLFVKNSAEGSLNAGIHARKDVTLTAVLTNVKCSVQINVKTTIPVRIPVILAVNVVPA